MLAITLTGGLWYGGVVAAGVEEVARFGVLCFAAICNLCLVFAAMRIRDVLQSHLEKMEQFNLEYFASGRPEQPMLPPFGRNSMITIYSVLMIMAALLSMAGAVVVYLAERVVRLGSGRCLAAVTGGCRDSCVLPLAQKSEGAVEWAVGRQESSTRWTMLPGRH